MNTEAKLYEYFTDGKFSIENSQLCCLGTTCEECTFNIENTPFCLLEYQDDIIMKVANKYFPEQCI